jgi:hypothetical protein
MLICSDFSAPSPSETLRAALMSSLHRAHRPELADVIDSADLAVDRRGLWVRPADAALDPAWLESQLQSAALAGGLSVASIHVLRGLTADGVR